MAISHRDGELLQAKEAVNIASRCGEGRIGVKEECGPFKEAVTSGIKESCGDSLVMEQVL